ncbi:MAG: helix-turn-helix transcriptional regulator [Terrimicrobiaceae bacterium]|nr:helix-turn-helix transcriptional regulator [Terrimicrobiaceae bacterium]
MYLKNKNTYLVMPSVKNFKPQTALSFFRRKFLFRGRPSMKQKYSQADLAKDLGVSTVRVQQLELGTKPLPEKHAIRLQELFGISAEWLLAGDPKCRPTTPDGHDYSSSIAYLFRSRNALRRIDCRPDEDAAASLALALEALLSETRVAVIRTADSKGIPAAWMLFLDVRAAFLESLGKSFPTGELSKRLQNEASRIANADAKTMDAQRLDITTQHLEGAADVGL